ncbi:hypothetical protein Rs2_34540 [Raphanus sativus]|nr:hypothetical protein Rs2_34540 [Raphanus sativus]
MGHPRPLSRPVGPIPSDGRSLIFQGSKSLFTDPAITTRPFPVLWPHLHAIANHFPIGHPSFHYSSLSTLNSGVLSGCVPEKKRGRMMKEAERVLKANMEKLMERGFNESKRLSPGGPDPRHH